MLLFLVLAGNSPRFDFYIVTRSFSSRLFLCALAFANSHQTACKAYPTCNITANESESVDKTTSESKSESVYGNLGMGTPALVVVINNFLKTFEVCLYAVSSWDYPLYANKKEV